MMNPFFRHYTYTEVRQLYSDTPYHIHSVVNYYVQHLLSITKVLVLYQIISSCANQQPINISKTHISTTTKIRIIMYYVDNITVSKCK